MLIKLLDDLTNRYVYIESKYITTLSEDSDGNVRIHTLDGSSCVVRETMEDIFNKIYFNKQ